MAKTNTAVERLSAEYFAYMRSPEWKAKRDTVIYLKGTICRLCKQDSIIEPDVHHMTYERFGNEHMDDLIVVCRPCHDRIHQQQQNTRQARLAKPASFDSRLNGWATTVYGINWLSVPGRDVAAASFRRWLFRKEIEEW